MERDKVEITESLKQDLYRKVSARSCTFGSDTASSRSARRWKLSYIPWDASKYVSFRYIIKKIKRIRPINYFSNGI